MSTVTMNVSLTEELKEFAQKRVESGQFKNPSDYVRALIRQDIDRQGEKHLEELLLEGLASGRGREVTPKSRAEFRKVVEKTIEDVARKQIFHYMIFANSQNASGEPGVSGLAELPGNDAVITFGGWGLNSDTWAEKHRLINYQAAAIMHELGHNFGLKHGGFENTFLSGEIFFVSDC